MSNPEAFDAAAVEFPELDKPSPEELFNELLLQLPENMRRHAELRNISYSIKYAMRMHREKLRDSGVEASDDLLAGTTVLNGLKLNLSNKHLAIVEAELSRLESAGASASFQELAGREVRVEPIGDETRFTLISSQGGCMGVTKKPTEGVVIAASLGPRDGGFVKLQHRGIFFRGYDRVAAPLVYPNSYEPQFQIEFL